MRFIKLPCKAFDQETGDKFFNDFGLKKVNLKIGIKLHAGKSAEQKRIQLDVSFCPAEFGLVDEVIFAKRVKKFVDVLVTQESNCKFSYFGLTDFFAE